ncbi:yap-binding protein-like protein [Sporothrix brasiliensis 5110]|uniref:Yap-binding protein-like protein n=1 Tax=Sporothrix brasiliensis 5110 TaxID=1398154 RepID=A0A0C2IS49_9PEZI|nr:yap-binding protein-like protein [Sporothrix brasiliensis 5110]KIH91861.1 yap-binding protein-like protein [Sporothrix brasiliensis 5110]
MAGSTATAAPAPATAPAPPDAASESIEALIAARPPATDRFTYLTLIEEHLSPEVLPTLHAVLQDASLTQELGWDLVDMLVPLLPASEACLDDVARLGNPREVILKVLEVLERLAPSRSRGGNGAGDVDEDDDVDREPAAGDDEEDSKAPNDTEATTVAFVALLGMLAILHRRLKTKYPSRFLETTLRTILAAYRPTNAAMTTAIMGLVRSLATRRRPAPPMRRSDSQLSELALAKSASPSSAATATAAAITAADAANAAKAASRSAIGKVGADYDRSDDAAASVPDPEAEEQVAPSEGDLQQRLLQSFVTCILEAYVNANDVAWAPRLIEFYYPKRVVPGRPTELSDFREDPSKIARDASVSQLVALALDLGLKYSDALVASVSKGPERRNPFADLDVAEGGVDSISLSTGGVICLLAYWVFSSDVFKSDAAVPNLRVFPDYYAILETFLDGNAGAQIAQWPGTVEALVAIGLWLDHHKLYSRSNDTVAAARASYAADDFMPYHHLLTLCSVFHPSLAVRNAATTLAGSVLHTNPDAEDRLKILQDLLENCMFASLKACAVTWLREEIVAATAETAATTETADDKTADDKTLFSGPDAVEQLQYAIFPDLQALAAADADKASSTLVDYWLQNAPFLLQAANFAYFLFCSDKLKATVVPPGMGPAIEQRYVEPLLQAATRLRSLVGGEAAAAAGRGQGRGLGHGHSHDDKDGDGLQHAVIDLDVLTSRLSSIRFS